MDRKEGAIVTRIIVSFIFACGFPLTALFIFKSNIDIMFIMMFSLAKPVCSAISGITGSIRYRSAEKSREGMEEEFLLSQGIRLRIQQVCNIISGSISIVMAVFIVVSILITPANLYLYLFQAIRANMFNSGRVSNLFVLFIAFSSTHFSAMIVKKGYTGPLVFMGFTISFLMTLIFQNIIFYAVSLVFILLCIFYIAFAFLEKGNRRGSILFSIIIIAICLGCGYGLHSMFNFKGSKTIDRITVSLRSMVSFLFPQVPLLYEIPEFGFSFEDEFKNKLGSTPVLSDVPMFEVTANPEQRSVYLRTRIHDQLRNNIWETPAYYQFLIERSTELEYRGKPVTIPLVQGDGPKKNDEISVRLLGEYFSYLPHTLETAGFRFPDRAAGKSIPSAVFGDFDYGFYLDNQQMLVSGDTVILGQGTEKREAPASFAPYLQVPANLPVEIRIIAKTFETIPDPHIKAGKIAEYLAINYVYNIDTGELAKDENFLKRFMVDTKQGFCVHFATAYIMLARLNNIPCRYATGFLAIIPQPKKEVPFTGYKTRISGLSAHVWPEVWYNDTGWTTEEATPAVNPDFYTQTENGYVFRKGITVNQRTQEQLTSMLGEQVYYEKESKPFTIDISINPVFILTGVSVPLFCFLLIRYYYLLVYMARKNRKTALMLLKKTVKKFSRKGLQQPKEIGWIEWAERLSAHAPKYRKQAEELAGIIIPIVYGGYPAAHRQVEFIFRFYRQVKIGKIRVDKTA